jgi:hypothetical protein
MSISFVSSSAATDVATHSDTVSNPGLPTSFAAGDLLILGIGQHYNTTGDFSVATAGWSAPAKHAYAAGESFASMTGPARVGISFREADGSETGTLTVNVSGSQTNTVTMTRTAAFRKTLGTWDYAVQSAVDWTRAGSHTTGNASTPSTATSGAMPLAAGDWLLVAYAQPSAQGSTGQVVSHTLTAAGLTFGSIEQCIYTGNTAGNQVALRVLAAEVLTGSATVPVTFDAVYTATGHMHGPAIFIRLREVPIVVDGAAGFTGESSLAAAGTVVVNGGAALTAESNLAAAGASWPEGAAAYVGEGNLTVAGVPLVDGAAALTGESSLVLEGASWPEGAVSYAGGGALVAAGEVVVDGALDLAGGSELEVTTEVIDQPEARFAGEGTLVVAGASWPEGAAAFTGEGVLVVVGEVLVDGAAELAGDGALVVDGQTVPEGVVELAGESELTMTAMLVIEGAAALVGEGTLAIQADLELAGAADLAGDGTLVIAGEIVVDGAAALTAQSAMAVAGANWPTGAAAFAGESSLTITAGQAGFGSAAFTGQSALTLAHSMWTVFDDKAAAAREEYEYQVVAVGTNGARQPSEWVT